MNIPILSTKMWYCFVNLAWLAKTYLSWICEFGIINYLKLVVHVVTTICSVACLAVYRKLGVLIYSNLNCDLKMRLYHMSLMVLKHLLQVGLLHLLGVKSLSPCCFLRRLTLLFQKAYKFHTASMILLELQAYKNYPSCNHRIICMIAMFSFVYMVSNKLHWCFFFCRFNKKA
jgi:hypothetical protein